MLFPVGRLLFAVAITAFGIIDLIEGRFVVGCPPVPSWTPGGPILAYVLGAVLTLAGLGIATNFRPQLSAAVVGLIFFLSVFLVHAFKVQDILQDAGARTAAFEALALGCAAFILAAQLPTVPSSANIWKIAVDRWALVARYLFAFSIFVFGVQHFMLATFIASLVPAWLPGHLFWAYFTGIGFIAAGMAIAINVQAQLGAMLLGAMFLLWVLLLHLPRSVVARTNPDEWASLFVALGLCGSSWIIASWKWPSTRANALVS
jgi:uncharacterized membrane protein YphA (DoxX/SURF4 family)